MKKSSASKVSRKALSVFMSVVLAVGLMPLPAYAELAPGSAGDDSQALVPGTSSDLISGGLTDDAGTQAGPESSLSPQDEGDFDKVGDSDYCIEGYFRYYYEITSITEGSCTATIHFMDLMYDDNDVDHDGKVSEPLLPEGGFASLDWSIPATITSKRGEVYTVTEFKGSLLRPIQDFDNVDPETGLGELYRPAQFMKSITIPASIEKISTLGNAATVPASWSPRNELDGVKSITFQSGSKVTELPQCFAHQFRYLESLTLPQNLETVGDFAFWECFSLRNLSLPSTVTSIGLCAFADVDLATVDLPDGLQTIGAGAFSWAGHSAEFFGDKTSLIKQNYLTSVTIPNSVKTIGAGAFAEADPNCSVSYGADGTMDIHPWWRGSYDPDNDTRGGLSHITSITLGKGVETIGEGAFAGCLATTVTIPASVKTIEPDAFAVSSLREVKWADENAMQLETLGGFRECLWLQSIDIPSSVTTIGNSAFNTCKGLKNIFIPAGVTTIEAKAFQYSGLTSFTIAGGSAPMTIESRAFDCCYGLSGATITLPKRVATLGASVFENITNATYMVYNDQLEIWDKDRSAQVGVEVPVSYVTEEFKAKWDTNQWEDQVDTMYIFVPCAWQDDQWEVEYDTSDKDHYIPEVDVSSSTVYYPETLTHETSLSFWAYVENAQAKRASYEDGNTYRVMFNLPRFVPFDAGEEIEMDDVVDVRGGDGIIEVLTTGAAGTDARVCVLNTAGDLVASGQAAKGYAAIEGIRDGKYTVIAFANNARFSTIGSERDLAAMGVDAAHYAKKTGVVVKDGSSAEVSLSVPALSSTTLDSVLKSSAVNIGKADVMMQTEVFAAVSFTLKDGYSANELTMKVPAGLTVTSVYSRYQDYQGTRPRKATFNSSSRTLTVDISDGRTLDSDGVNRLWVGLKPVLPGYYSVNASVKANGITVPIGSAPFNSYAVSIDTPTEPVLDAQDTVVPVTVHAAPGSYVAVTMGSKTYQAGPTNKSGSATLEINLWDAVRDAGQPIGVASFATSFLATASLEIGGVTYTDSGTVGVVRDDSANVRLYNFSFMHAGTTYDLVKNGREHRMGTYYTYVANDMKKNEYWTFKATFKSNKKLDKDATVQIQMLDGSSRYAKMKLVNQVYTGDALGGTWTAIYSTTVRIEQAGDHVFPSNLVPCGFDAFYGLDVEEDLPNQDDVNVVKWNQRWAVGPADLKTRAKSAVRELNPTVTEDELTAIANADATTALFNTFYGYMSGSVFDGGGDQISGQEAFDSYVDAIWEVAKDDPDFKQTLENAAPEGSTITIPTDNKPEGRKQVKKILFGEGENNTGGAIGTIKDMGELMYTPEISGVDKKPSECTGATPSARADQFAEQFLETYLPPDTWQNDPDWLTMSDDDANNLIFQGQTEMEGLLGTPSSGNDLTANLLPPNKFGVKVNRTDDANGIPKSYEIADSNGNHVKFNVPELAGEFMAASDKKGFIADKLKNSFKEYANEKLSGKKTMAAVEAYKGLIDKQAAITQKMMDTGIGLNEALANAVSNKAKGFWDSQWKGVADTVAAYDILKQKVQSWTWQDTLNLIDKAKAERDAAKAKAARYLKNPSVVVSELCKSYLEALEIAYGDLFKWLNEKAGAMLSDYGFEAMWIGLTSVGNATLAGKAKDLRSLWKYDIGGVKTKIDKMCSSLEKKAKNYWEWLNELCDPKKNASYQTTVILDPSGIVYDGFEGNPISGVTATVYEVSDPAHPVLWNAAEYDQVNPQTTGADGAYGWNVPVGQWQVSFTKDGYESAMTGVLPVPPPQMGLSTPMFTTAEPKVVAVNATVATEGVHGLATDYVEIVFDQYMNTTSKGTVYVDNVEAEDYLFDWRNVESGVARDVEGGEALNKGVSKVLRVPLPSGKAIGDKVKVEVVGFENYSGITVSGGYLGTFDVPVRQLPTSIEFVSGVGEESPLAVAISDEGNAANNNDGTGSAVVLVKCGSKPLAGANVTVSLDTDELAMVGSGTTYTGTTDSQGKLTIPLKGKLPGMSVITATADSAVSTSGQLLTTFANATQVARPIVRVNDEVVIGMGSAAEVWKTVAPGAQLTLSCATEGATIYYTTNGDCPCDDASTNRRAYQGPITVSENMLIRVGAEKAGLDDSERVKVHLTLAGGLSDKTDLQAALNKASASPYTDAVRVSDDGSDVPTNEKWVTQEMKDALAKAKEAAAAVMGDAGVDQSVVDQKLADLNAAMAAYVPKAGTQGSTPGPGPEPGPQPEVKTNISGATIAPIPPQTYTSYRVEPALTVSLGGKNLAKGTDFTVTYDKNIEVGTATATITGIGLYEGAKSATFKIEHRDPTTMFSDFDANGWYLETKPGSGSFAGAPSTLYLDYILARGIMSGYSGTTKFGPDDSVSRAQVAVILYRADQNKTAETTDNKVKPVFVDCGYDEYYSRAVQWAYENKIVTGYTDGSNRFGPNDPVTREQLATMIHRFAVTYRHTQDASKDLGYYVDAGTVSPYAVAAMRYNVAIGAMGAGGNRLNPQDGASRVQTAKIVAVVLHDVVGM